MKPKTVPDPKSLTPMLRDYHNIAANMSDDVVILFRVGDFYEMFFDDALRAAPILGLALTHRAGHPMCGIPYHAIDTYLAKLIRAGHPVALAERMEASRIWQVMRIVTPGTLARQEAAPCA